MAGFEVAAGVLVEPKHLNREGCSECGIKKGLPHNKDCSHNNGKAVGVKELFEPRCVICGWLLEEDDDNLTVCKRCSKENVVRCSYCSDTGIIPVFGGPDMFCPFCGPKLR